MSPVPFQFLFFFFNDTATTEIYTLSLHDALPIYQAGGGARTECAAEHAHRLTARPDRKSTRLNSSHHSNSYAVFCLKKKTVSQPGHRRFAVGRAGLGRSEEHTSE